MADNRLNRELENRAATERKKSWTPPQTLPTPAPHDGWAFRWIRTSMMGQADPMNTSAKFREGWEPVRAEDHPELKLSADPRSAYKDNIEIGGLLLCKAPQEMVNERNAYYAKQATSQMDAVDNNFMKASDPRMPMDALGAAIERKSTTSFGRGK